MHPPLGGTRLPPETHRHAQHRDASVAGRAHGRERTLQNHYACIAWRAAQRSSQPVREPRAISESSTVADPQRAVPQILRGNGQPNEAMAVAQLPDTSCRIEGSIMGIISWLVVGAIAGILAGFFVTGDEGLGIIGRILLGIVGAVVGGFIAGALTGGDFVTGINITTIIVATIGAIIVVFAYNLLTRSRSGRGAV